MILNPPSAVTQVSGYLDASLLASVEHYTTKSVDNILRLLAMFQMQSEVGLSLKLAKSKIFFVQKVSATM